MVAKTKIGELTVLGAAIGGLASGGFGGVIVGALIGFILENKN